MDNQIYDLVSNRIFVRGFKESINNIEYVKILKYPHVFDSLYTISESGKIYSMMNDNYLEWGIRNRYPFVNLTCKINGNISLEPFYIKDLVAYNYIADADSYLERRYKVINVDGNPMNNNYQNIMYISTE